MNAHKETFKTRFNKALSVKNIKPTELAEKTGLSKSTISHYMSGYTKPKSDKLFILAKALNVSEQWLMGLDAPMERFDPEVLKVQKESRNQYAEKWNIQFYEKKMLDSFSKLNDDNKKKGISYAENLLQNQILEEELSVRAAHQRTDQKPTEEDQKHDDDIMNNDSEWE
ncbi:helix-turn-helix domain-containing protein [Ruminococcus sp. OA3]|uniref:helix-turn-helix domain-containing protein n=1 Tax=Ruminococcus sp. OA3 TaxID=2914164 RepID=UPI001F06F56B|nr:helix-turn-helix domain-containing protein [Ruminococcus sp. OA3]MCH1982458.1 helix-turn-helix domain-containing protein [Ruminococcus sp. OA3]